MKHLWAKIITFTISIGLLIPELVSAVGGGSVEKVVFVADTRNLSGIMACCKHVQ